MKIKSIITIVLFAIISCSFAAQANEVSGELQKLNENGFLQTGNCISIVAPAVAQTDYGYVGVPVNIDVIVSNGSGHVYMDTMPLTDLDMQGSARIAVKVAFDICGKDADEYDVHYVIRSDVPIIGGPSAGATLCVATIAALNNWSINKNVMMTGMISPDGSIGPVGGIIEKMEAAKGENAEYFLIPSGERYINTSNGRIDAVEYGNSLGIKVIEVKSIYDAIYYFTNHKVSEHKYLPNPIVEEEYSKMMEKLSSQVLEKSKTKYATVKQKLETNYMNYELRQKLEGQLKDAENTMMDSNQLYLNKYYYASTSKSFNALITLERIDATLQYHNGGDVKEYLLDIQKDLEYKKEYINNQKISKGNIEYIIASKSRIYESDELLDKAWKNYYNGKTQSAIEYGAYAKLRGESAIWWLNLGDNSSMDFQEKQENLKTSNANVIDESELKFLAQEYLDNSEIVVIYSSMVLPSTLTMDATKSLEDAKKYYNKKEYLLAISKSIDANVYATTSLDFMEDTDYLKNLARNKINMVENYGLNKNDKDIKYVPVSALGYYEYADSLDDKVSKILYYKYSIAYAQMNVDILKQFGSSSQISTIEETKGCEYQEDNLKDSQNHIDYNGIKSLEINKLGIILNISYLIIGLICGVVVGYAYRTKISKNNK